MATFQINKIYYMNGQDKCVIYEKNESEETTGYYVLTPQKEIIINYTATEINANGSGGFIRITPNETSQDAAEQEKEYYDFTIEEGSLKEIRIVMPEVKSNSNIIYFKAYTFTTTTNQEENTDEITLTLQHTIKYEGYDPPIISEIKKRKIIRVNKEYADDPNGTYIKIQSLAIEIVSGIIDKDKDIKIKYDNNFTEPISGVTKDILSSNGYSDTDSLQLLSQLNESETFKDNKEDYSIKIVFQKKVLTANNEGFGSEDQQYEVVISLVNSVIPLQLIGKTTLSSGNIYGGVTIGTMPKKISKIGEPTFECGYRAYFNGTSYGYYPGDTIEIKSEWYSMQGYLTSSNKNLFITIPIGQPIFADSFTISGHITARSNDNYLTNMKYTKPFDLSNPPDTTYKVQTQIIEKRAGILGVFIERTKSNGGTNNHPVVLNAEPDITITFI